MYEGYIVSFYCVIPLGVRLPDGKKNTLARQQSYFPVKNNKYFGQK
jgi:hypothetical protein